MNEIKMAIRRLEIERENLMDIRSYQSKQQPRDALLDAAKHIDDAITVLGFEPSVMMEG